MSFAKDNLAKLIQQGAPFSELSQATRNVKKYPKFEVRRKRLSEGIEINIQNAGWIDATEWAENHINHLIRDFNETSSRLNYLGVRGDQLYADSFFLTKEDACERIIGISEFLFEEGFTSAEDAKYLEDYLLDIFTHAN